MAGRKILKPDVPPHRHALLLDRLRTWFLARFFPSRYIVPVHNVPVQNVAPSQEPDAKTQAPPGHRPGK
jgi:hypothetical protein